MALRDHCWLWGHPEGVYNLMFGNNRASRITPMECCEFLGVKNTFMVPVGIRVDRRQYNKSFTTLHEVAWECFDAYKNPAVVETVIEEAREFPNITRVVFDDFQRHGLYKEINVEDLWAIRKRLHENEVRPLEMWMVLYTYEFGEDPEKDEDFQRYIEPFDGVIMWTWEERDVPLIPEKFEIFKALTPHQRRLFGCYLYNFGENKQADGRAVRWQLDWYRERIRDGEAEGIVLHSNPMADLDFEAFDVARDWMKAHGDEALR